METAVALPTLTPLQISFGWGEKKRHAGWVGLGLSVCVSVCGKRMGVDDMEARIQSGTKQDYITNGENVPAFPSWVHLHVFPPLGYTDPTGEITNSFWANPFSSSSSTHNMRSQPPFSITQSQQFRVRVYSLFCPPASSCTFFFYGNTMRSKSISEFELAATFDTHDGSFNPK